MVYNIPSKYNGRSVLCMLHCDRMGREVLNLWRYIPKLQH